MPTAKGTRPWNYGQNNGWTDKRGYKWFYVTVNGRKVAKRQHRQIMEDHLGRALEPEELVHHINGDRGDNRIENLELRTWSDHSAEHSRGHEASRHTKRTIEVMANYRHENARLRESNAQLLEALKEAAEALEEVSGWAIQEGCVDVMAATPPTF